MLNINLLNAWAHEIVNGNLLDTYFPFEGNLDDAIQIEKYDAQAFNLLATSGYLKEVKNETPAPKDHFGITRYFIGYTLALKMQNNKNIFYYEMFNLINRNLNSFTRKFGDLKGRKVICERPGEVGVYFRELENAAAIELRFYVPHENKDE